MSWGQWSHCWDAFTCLFDLISCWCHLGIVGIGVMNMMRSCLIFTKPTWPWRQEVWRPRWAYGRYYQDWETLNNGISFKNCNHFLNRWPRIAAVHSKKLACYANNIRHKDIIVSEFTDWLIHSRWIFRNVISFVWWFLTNWLFFAFGHICIKWFEPCQLRFGNLISLWSTSSFWSIVFLWNCNIKILMKHLSKLPKMWRSFARSQSHASMTIGIPYTSDTGSPL